MHPNGVTSALGVRSKELKVSNAIRSITIGSFDGIHLAHQALIDKAEAVVVIERNGGYLTPGYKRSLYVNKPLFFYHFDKIRVLSPEAFVARLQEDFPVLEKIVVGYDFAFGKEKRGNGKMLSQLFDGEVEIVGEICVSEIPVHSRTIKGYLAQGDIEMANRLLGRSYRIDGEVIRGQGLGEKAFVPTINLHVRDYQLPTEGVYATRTKVEDAWYKSVSFIGHRVSTDGSFAVETHIIDKEIRDVPLEVWIMFEGFIRSNRAFENFDALKAQILRDIEIAKSF